MGSAYLLPRLDVVSLYRFYGLGHDLISQGDGSFNSALGNLTTGDFQEWTLGVEYQDNEELKGEAKISKRDRNRWELDPASSDDWDER